jgi:hypothetical protein
MPVRCWKRPEDVVCLRHRRWTGPGSGAGQPGLSAILQAHKRRPGLLRKTACAPCGTSHLSPCACSGR